jgi:hypothetical protein
MRHSHGCCSMSTQYVVGRTPPDHNQHVKLVLLYGNNLDTEAGPAMVAARLCRYFPLPGPGSADRPAALSPKAGESCAGLGNGAGVRWKKASTVARPPRQLRPGRTRAPVLTGRTPTTYR